VAQVPTPTSGATAEHDANGHSPSPSEDDTGAEGAIEVSLPPAKKQTRESSSEDADARLAAELQAQENRLSRGRVTRGAGVAKPKAKAKPKTTKKKSAKRVRSDDDSNAEDGEDKPKRKAGGGFQKPFNLSHQLADVVGETQVGAAHFFV
jgi:upstream activation factor subunit UAF30